MPYKPVNQKRYRARRKQHIQMMHVPVDLDLIETLINIRWLSEEEALKRVHVEGALAEIVNEWKEVWKKAAA